MFVVGIFICIQFELQQFSNYFSGLVFHPAMNVPFQICSFIDVVCELVADFSCFFHCLVYCFGLTAFCMWFNKGQAALFGLAWLPVVCENLLSSSPTALPERFVSQHKFRIF